MYEEDVPLLQQGYVMRWIMPLHKLLQTMLILANISNILGAGRAQAGCIAENRTPSQRGREELDSEMRALTSLVTTMLRSEKCWEEGAKYLHSIIG